MTARWLPPPAVLLLCLATGFGSLVLHGDGGALPPDPARPEVIIGVAARTGEPTAAAIFRYEPAAATAAATDFDRAFVTARTAFCRELARTLGPLPLATAAISGPDFEAVWVAWSTQWRGFPPKPDVARAWAQEQDGERLVRPLRDRLAQVMSERRVRESVATLEELQGPVEVQLVPLDPAGGRLTLERVAAEAQPFRRPRLYSLAQAREEVRAGWPREDWAAARFAATLVRPNTFFEVELTRETRRPVPAVTNQEGHGPAPALLQPARREGPGDAAVTSRSPPVPSGWMQWLLLAVIPASFCAGALWLAAVAARGPAAGDAPGFPGREFPRLTSLEQRLAHLEPQLRGRMQEFEDRIRRLEDELPPARREHRATLRRELFQVRLERDGELVRLGLSRN